MHVVEDCDTWLTTENRKKVKPKLVKSKKLLQKSILPRMFRAVNTSLLEVDFTQTKVIAGTKQTSISSYFNASDQDRKKTDSQGSDDSELPHFLSLDTKQSDGEEDSQSSAQKQHGRHCHSEEIGDIVLNHDSVKCGELQTDWSSSDAVNPCLLCGSQQGNSVNYENISSSSLQYNQECNSLQCNSSQRFSCNRWANIDRSRPTADTLLDVTDVIKEKDEPIACSSSDIGEDLNNRLTTRISGEETNNSLTRRKSDLRQMPKRVEQHSESDNCHLHISNPEIFKIMKGYNSKPQKFGEKCAKIEAKELCLTEVLSENRTVVKEKSANVGQFHYDTELTLDLSPKMANKCNKRNRTSDKENAVCSLYDRTNISTSVTRHNKRTVFERPETAELKALCTVNTADYRNRGKGEEILLDFTLDLCDFSRITAKGTRSDVGTSSNQEEQRVSEVPDSYWSLGTTSQGESISENLEGSDDFCEVLSDLSQTLEEDNLCDTTTTTEEVCPKSKVGERGDTKGRTLCAAFKPRVASTRNSKRKSLHAELVDIDLNTSRGSKKAKLVVNDDTIHDSYFTLSV